MRVRAVHVVALAIAVIAGGCTSHAQPKLGTVTGRVTVFGGALVPRLPTGTPIGNAQVQVVGTQTARITTGLGGRYTVKLRPGRYTLGTLFDTNCTTVSITVKAGNLSHAADIRCFAL